MCPVPNAQVKMTSSSNEQGWVTLIQTIHNGGVFLFISPSQAPSPLIARRLQYRGRADGNVTTADDKKAFWEGLEIEDVI